MVVVNDYKSFHGCPLIGHKQTELNSAERIEPKLKDTKL